MPVSPSTWGQRQEDWKFQDNLGYKVNVRPKWTAQGDSISENKHNKPPGQKGPQVKTGPLRRPALPFFSFPVRGHSYSLNSWAPLHVPFPRKGSHGINSDSLGFNSTVLPLHLCCRIFNSAPREFLHSMWSRSHSTSVHYHSTYHTVLSPKAYSSLAMAWRLQWGQRPLGILPDFLVLATSIVHAREKKVRKKFY